MWVALVFCVFLYLLDAWAFDLFAWANISTPPCTSDDVIKTIEFHTHPFPPPRSVSVDRCRGCRRQVTHHRRGESVVPQSLVHDDAFASLRGDGVEQQGGSPSDPCPLSSLSHSPPAHSPVTPPPHSMRVRSSQREPSTCRTCSPTRRWW